MRSEMTIDGLPVRDGKEKLRIHITTQDAAKGGLKDPGTCAAARACKRDIPGCKAARVHLSRTYIKMKDHWVRYGTGGALKAELVAFDRGGQFEAGYYTLTPIWETSTKEGRAWTRAYRGKVKAKKKKLARATKTGRTNLSPGFKVNHIAHTTNVRFHHGANR